MGGSSKQTVGYRYFMDLLMGFGRGSCDAFRKIRIGGRDAWAGNVTENSVIRIDKPDLFGGDDGMGGVVGDLHIQMGEPSQQRNPLIIAAFGPLTSAMRGACTGFFTGQIAAMNPTPEEWEVQRTTILMGWDGAVWYPEKASVMPEGLDVPAMNGVHILMKVLTHRDCGRGLSPLRIDLDRYAAAADTLHAEGLGLCLRWNRQVSVLEFQQQVCDHIGASQFVSRSTGKLTISLARGGYDVEELPLFTFDDGLVEIEEDDNPSGWGATNEVIVEWNDPETNKTRQTRWQNLAAIQAYGRVSETIRYPGIPTAKLAARIAQRDGEIRSSGAKRFNLVLDQRGYEIEPAGLFRVSAPEHGIEQIVLRASDIRDEPQTSGRIRILAVQDVFGLEATTYVAEQQSTHQEPDRTPQAATVRQLAELSYRDMAVALGAADVAAIEPTMSGLMMLAQRPSSMALNYQLATRIGSSAFEVKTTGDWCPSAQLVNAITATDTVLSITAGSDLHLVELGESVRIDNEIGRLEAKDLVAGTITIARGCVDTVPAAHAGGARIWFPDSGACVDPTDYLTDTVSAKVLTRTSTGVLSVDVAPTDTIALGARQARPYPPARVRINGVAYPATAEDQVIVSWAHRDRLLQLDQLVDNEAVSIGPEPGTTYTVRFYNDTTNALLHSQSGVTGSSATYVHNADVSMRAEVESVRDGLVSLQKHVRRFAFVAPDVVTWNPADKSSLINLSNGNLTATRASAVSEWKCARASVARNTGKFYFEIRGDSIGSNGLMAGLATTAFPIEVGNPSSSPFAWCIHSYDGQPYHNGLATGAPLGAISNGQRFGCAVDFDAGKIWWRRNGTWVGDPAAGTGARHTFTPNLVLLPLLGLYVEFLSCTGGFAGADFANAPPAGFSPWGV